MYKGLCKCHSVGFFILFSRRFTLSIAVTHVFHAAVSAIDLVPLLSIFARSSNRFYQSRASPNPTLLRLNSLSLLELVTLDLSNLSLSNLSLKLKTNLSHRFCSRAHSWELLTRELHTRGRTATACEYSRALRAGVSTHVSTPTNS